MNEYYLKDLLSIRNGRDYKELKKGNVPVFGSGGLMLNVNESLYTGKSILLPRKGSLKNIQYIDGSFWTVDTIYYTDINESMVVPYFLYYYLKQMDLSRLNTGTGVPSMTFDSYYNIKVELPTIGIQEKVSKKLSLIDNKISNNTSINHILESMAKLLYDYWFVQFDFPDENGKPYKSSGGKMVWNERLKREIPEGWNVKNLLHIASFTNGLACQNYRPVDDNHKLPVIKIKEMHEGITSETEFVRDNIPNHIKIHNGDVLFSWSASLDVMLWTAGDGGLNQHIFKVTSNNSYPKSFYYFQLLEYVDNFKRIAESRKTTMGHITRDHLIQSTIAVPNSVDIPNMLEKKLRSIMDQIVKLNQQNQLLASYRDFILPMLMNGQVSMR